MTVSFAFPLKPSETGTSYTSRLTRYLGHSSPYHLCTELGVDWPTVKRGDYDHLERISEIGGADLDKLLHWSVRARGDYRYTICNEEVTKKTMTRSKLRVCPKCILEDIEDDGMNGVYRRYFWQFYAIRTCKKHDSPLVQLPVEQHTISNFDIVGQVDRHFDLICREADKASVRKFTPFEAYLQKRLSSARRILFLDGFKMHVAAKLCETLGATMLFDRTRKMRDLSNDDLREAGKVGFKATENKSTMRKAFADLWNHGDGQARHKTDLGHLYAWLTREPEHPDNSDLKDFISQIVFSTYPVRPGTTVFKRPCPKSVKFSLTTASEEFGVSYQRLARLAEHAGVATQCRITKQTILKEPLTRQKINGFLKSADRYLSNVQARELLGLDKPTFDNLILYGVIKEVESPVDPERCFHRGDLTWLIRDIRAKTKTSAARDQELFKFECVWSRDDIPAAEVFHAIRQGELPRTVMPEGSQRLDSLQLDEKDYREFLDDRGISSAMPAADVAVQLEMPKHMVHELVRREYLESKDTYLWVNSSRYVCGICPESVCRFEETYVTIRKLLIWNDVERGRLVSQIAKLGITPIILKKSLPRIFKLEELKKSRSELAECGIALQT